jgi:hypothetical protein
VSDSFLPESDRYLNGAVWQQALRKISVPVVLGVTANDGLATLMLNVTLFARVFCVHRNPRGLRAVERQYFLKITQFVK